MNKILPLAAILFTAVPMAGGWAHFLELPSHFLELPNKVGLSRDQ
jgi:hypothetical protein